MASRTPLTPRRSLVQNPLFYIFLGLVFTSTTAVGTLFATSLLAPTVVTAVIAGLVLFFERPLILLATLIILRMSLDALSEITSVPIGSFTLTLSQLLGLAIAALGLLILLVYRDRLRRFPLLPSFLIFFVYGCLTLLFTLSPAASLQELVRVFDLFVLGFLAYLVVRSEDDYRTLYYAIALSAFVPVLTGLYQYVLGTGLRDITVSIPRIYGTFSHPNVFSLYLFALAALALTYFSTMARNTNEKRLALLFFGGFSFMIVLTFSRVAWVALLLFTSIVALIRYRSAFLPLATTVCLLFLLFAPFQDRVLESLKLDPDSSLLWRQTLWHDVTIQALEEGRTISGSGLDTFHIVAEDLRGIRLGPNEAHNDFVKFFVEGGIIGITALFVYLGSILYLLYRQYQQASSMKVRTLFAFLMLFFIVLEIAALTDNVFKNTPVQWLFFVATGGALALGTKRG